jgi:superfamily II RNA helicase
MNTVFELDTFQLRAKEAIDNNINVLVSAPTGSGKTWVAQYALEKTIINNINTKAIIYTCPIKSLCNEKFRDMSILYNDKENYNIGLMTGDIIINPDGNIIIMTTEVLLNLILNKNDEFDPKCIIFDEAHYINDDSRGHVWEKCIVTSLLNYDCILVLLSATIGNIEEMTTWLNAINNDKQFINIIKKKRPVPLREFLIDNTKARTFKKITADNDEDIRYVSKDPDPESYDLLPLNDINYNKVNKYWEKLDLYNYSIKFELETLCNQIKSNPNLGMPAIIFVLSKKKCIELANMIEETTYVTIEERNEILNFYDNNLKEFKDYSQFIDLRRCIEKGVGYHHSGLIPKIREVVEFLIKNKLIKLVFATETFAVGLNFPVKTVVITGLNKPTENGFRNFTVSEYKQMAGRAGRRFLDSFGNVIIWLYLNKNKKKNPYPSWIELKNITNGSVNNVTSKFIIEPNYILKNITKDSYQEISYKSFRYYNSKHIERDFTIPEKFSKLFEIEKKIMEFSILGISYSDKNYNKFFKKLKNNEQDEYKNFINDYKKLSIKSDIELYDDLEKSIIYFLKCNDFLTFQDNKYILTEKGDLAQTFNEINPIIFINHYDFIFSNKDYIIPMLSMFIDDGISLKEDKYINWEEAEIIQWEEIIENNYNDYMNKYPKWVFYPKNFQIVNEWLSNENITLEQISINYDCDIGLIIKILIKMYQVTDELINNLVKINKIDLTEFLLEKKNLIIRPPLTIDSLYVNI